ncbi:MAG: ATP-binding protein [Syntrophothermus sp.]
MNFIKNILNNYYYKIRIVLTFSLVTILLVVILSRISYQFIKEIYLSQITEQAVITVKMVKTQLDQEYIDILDLGKPSGSAADYFRELFARNLSARSNGELFIFDGKFNLVTHSDPSRETGNTEAGLLLNRHEILNLKPGSTVASLPFKGDDGSWYLWGFTRLNGNYWLALKESAGRLSQVESFSRIFWYIGMSGVIVILLLSLLISAAITKPLHRLIDFSREIGRGNMLVPGPEDIKGEIKALSVAMTMMRNDLIKNQKEKENILAQIAHEIRNPLGGIELLANLTREDLVKDGRKTDYLDRILSEVNGLKGLITAYLSYSRPVQAMPERIRLAKLIPEVTGLLVSDIKSKQACIEYRLNTDTIIFDPGHLKQIMINLLSNSLEAAEEQVKIIIQSNEEDGKVKLSVIDDGPGIEESSREKIFEPFYTTRKNGTGLGLAVCRKLCYENKADIFLEKTDKETCITIMKEAENESE